MEFLSTNWERFFWALVINNEQSHFLQSNTSRNLLSLMDLHQRFLNNIKKGRLKDLRVSVIVSVTLKK